MGFTVLHVLCAFVLCAFVIWLAGWLAGSDGMRRYRYFANTTACAKLFISHAP
jgi:hypothetical protein